MKSGKTGDDDGIRNADDHLKGIADDLKEVFGDKVEDFLTNVEEASAIASRPCERLRTQITLRRHVAELADRTMVPALSCNLQIESDVAGDGNRRKK
jgi:hypothetical protein